LRFDALPVALQKIQVEELRGQAILDKAETTSTLNKIEMIIIWRLFLWKSQAKS
jgi:hypothetical protein